MSDDGGERELTAYEVGNGDFVVCEDGNPDGWIRSDTVVPVVDDGHRDERRPARE